jgi:hypothetical protein
MEQEQPDLPPENAFVQDMSDFGNAAALRTEAHYTYAALNVAVWNTLLYVNLVVPVAAWHEVRDTEPVWNAQAEAWVWTKNFTLNSIDYTANLHGSIENGDSRWAMYVSQEGGYQDFLWYEGQARLIPTSGDWTLYQDPDNNEPYIDIEWENDLNSEYDNIKYINSIPNHPGKDGYIHYGRVEDESYEVFYDIFLSDKNQLIEIDYNDMSTAGRIKDSQFYGNEEWKCWNEAHQDISCE